MIGIAFRFLAGRYHATQWGRHVNEGVPEWPPSPWRLLRSLVATWKRTSVEVPQTEVEPILRALAAPPVFILPPASAGHTRHFMPWFKKGPDDRTLVFDTFVALGHTTEVAVLWPHVLLGPGQHVVLGRILTNMNFLGRAESWCEGRLLSDVEATECCKQVNCQPVNGPGSDGWDSIRVLCADPDEAFRNDAFLATKGATRHKSAVSAAARTVEYDPNWHLCVETLWLHQQRWSDPPGSRWVDYHRRCDCFEVTTAAAPRFGPPQPHPRPQVIRFAIDSNVLPLVTETLRVAEATRRALMSLYGRLTHHNGVRGRSDILSGKDSDGQPQRGHTHAYYLPTDEDGDGRLDHLTITATAGFGPEEMRAADRFRETRVRGTEGTPRPLRVLLLGYGSLDDFRPMPVRRANVWWSATPYVATRYAKTRGRQRIDLRSRQARTEFLIADLRTQIRVLRPDLTETHETVEIVPLLDGRAFEIASRWRPLQFKRFRQKRGDDGGLRLAGAFQLTFSGKGVRGPLALGHSAHFGMGLFLPARLSTTTDPILERDRKLAEIVRRLVAALHPERIYLFGSRARGEAGVDSDYDLLVVVADSDLPGHRRDQQAYRALKGVGAAKDVLVWTRNEFESRSGVVCSLPATVLREGKLLYAA